MISDGVVGVSFEPPFWDMPLLSHWILTPYAVSVFGDLRMTHFCSLDLYLLLSKRCEVD